MSPVTANVADLIELYGIDREQLEREQLGRHAREVLDSDPTPPHGIARPV